MTEYSSHPDIIAILPTMEAYVLSIAIRSYILDNKIDCHAPGCVSYIVNWTPVDPIAITNL